MIKKFTFLSMIFLFLSCNYNYSVESKKSPDLKVKRSHLKKTLNKKTTLNTIKKNLYNIKKYLYDNSKDIFGFAVLLAFCTAFAYKQISKTYIATKKFKEFCKAKNALEEIELLIEALKQNQNEIKKLKSIKN